MAIWDELFTQSPYLITLILIGIVAAASIVLERILTHYVRSFVRKRELPPDVRNGLLLFLRLMILAGAIIALLAIGGVPAEWLVWFSALGGAAVGFASSKTIGNFISGLFVLVLRPFRVHDYVRIGNIEGIIEEITINYTKIRTPFNSTVLISNQRILDQDITNFRCEETKPPIYCYSIELTFDHSIPTDRLEKTFDEVIQKYQEKVPKKPYYAMSTMTSFARHYMFYLYVESPEDILTLPSIFVRDINEAWQKAKAKSQI